MGPDQNIYYPRALNRPTYLFWRFTHKDVMAIAIVFCVSLMPSMFWQAIPPGPGLILVFLFMLYRGGVAALKPRGWDTHVVKSVFQPKQLNPGHTFRRCFVLPEIKSKSSLIERIKRSMGLSGIPTAK